MQGGESMVKHFSIHVDDAMFEKFKSLCEYYGRSVNAQVKIMIARRIEFFEKKHGELEPLEEKSSDSARP